MLEPDPTAELAGYDAALYLPGGVQEGYVVGVELGADGQLAGSLKVHERDLREVYGGRAAEARHVAEGFAEFFYGDEVELPVQPDLYASVARVLYFYAVQDLPFFNN